MSEIQTLFAVAMLTVIMAFADHSFAQVDTTVRSIAKEQVVAQLNYCINSITLITHSKSLELLEHESDQLKNNLTVEPIKGMTEIWDFRQALGQKIASLQITEMERQLVKQALEVRRKNMLISAISNSLDNPMILTGGGRSLNQVAFLSILTAARSAVDYKIARDEMKIVELQTLWPYRKKDLEDFAELEHEGRRLLQKTFQKYKLSEADRLTEKDILNFYKIVNNSSPNYRIRTLRDNALLYKGMADYYYYLGMAYIDNNDYRHAKPYLNKYVEMYQKAPIFRHDDKSGCVALAKLSADSTITPAEVLRLSDIVIKNLPNNGSALAGVVLALHGAKLDHEALIRLRAGIDNCNMTDKDALVVLAAEMLPYSQKYPSLRTCLAQSVNNCKNLSFETFVSFWSQYDFERFCSRVGSCIKLTNDGLVKVALPVNTNNLTYTSSHEQNVQPYRLVYAHSFTKEKVMKAVNCTKSNPKLIYLFCSPVGDSLYCVKPHLNYQAILRGELPGMTSFDLTQDDLEDIVSFCNKHSVQLSGWTMLEPKPVDKKFYQRNPKKDYVTIAVKVVKKNKILFHFARKNDRYCLYSVENKGIQYFVKH